MRQAPRTSLAALLLIGLSANANADAITDWNVKAGEIVVESKLGTPPAVRVMAIVQTSAYEAAKAVTKDASVDAAIAAAHRTALAKLLPSQQASIESAYQAALARIADGPAKAAGIAAGEKAAEAVLASRADDGSGATAAYRPHAAAGVYVPTAMPAVPQWTQRKPWLLASASQFRPGPPPPLASASWSRDYNEVKELGGKVSPRRSAEQAEIARFWEYSLPPIYFGVVHSVAGQPGRDLKENARLYAAAAQAMDDALIAVFDAKYHYNFWRPLTAIRNGDIDGNDSTEREASWTPFIDVPMHPEYPSAHSSLAAAVGAVLQAELGAGPVPVVATSSPTAKGATRRWTNIADFTREVDAARVWGGMHYRFSTDIGGAMGRQVGELAAQRFPRQQSPASTISASK